MKKAPKHKWKEGETHVKLYVKTPEGLMVDMELYNLDESARPELAQLIYKMLLQHNKGLANE